MLAGCPEPPTSTGTHRHLHTLTNTHIRVYTPSRTHSPYTHTHTYRCSHMHKQVKGTQLCLTPCNPTDYTIHGIFQARILEWVAVPFSRGSSQPRYRTQVSSLWADSLPAEPPGKPRNTGVGSLSLLQWLFPTQESNQGLPHCRWILYQLS